MRTTAAGPDAPDETALQAVSRRGRPSRKGTRSRLGRVGLGIAGVLVVTLLAGGAYQAAATARDLRHHGAPGELIDMGTHRMHLHCTGEGSPTVVLAHAGGSLSAQWALIQPELAEVTRVCSYDRSGFGWSGDRVNDADALSATRELATLLETAGETGPYVHVGHSFGAHIGALSATTRPHDTVGVVMVDPGYALGTPGVPADIDERFSTQDATLIRIGPWAARIGLMRLAAKLGAVPGHRDLPGGAGEAFDAFNLPTRHWREIRAEFDAWDQTSQQALDARARLDDVPLLVLSATTPDNRQRREWTAANERIAEQSAAGVHHTIADADHMGLALDAGQAAEVTGEIVGFLGQLPRTR